MLWLPNTSSSEAVTEELNRWNSNPFQITVSLRNTVERTLVGSGYGWKGTGMEGSEAAELTGTTRAMAMS